MKIPELEELVDLILIRHHQVERQMLEELQAKLQLGQPDKRLVAPFSHLFHELSLHMAKEETVLFPALRRLAAGELVDISCAIQAMEHEHNQIQTLNTALHAAARDAGELEPLMLELLDDLEEHIRVEDEELFPMAKTAMVDTAAQVEREAARDTLPEPAGKEASEPGLVFPIRHTRSICPQCAASVPATVEWGESTISLVQQCSIHGDSRTVLSEKAIFWSDVDEYYFSLRPWRAPQRDYQVWLSDHEVSTCSGQLSSETSPRTESGPGHLSAEAMLSRQRGNRIEFVERTLSDPEKLVDWVERTCLAGHTPVLRTRLKELTRDGLAGQLACAGLESLIGTLEGPVDGEIPDRRSLLSPAEVSAVAALREASIEVELEVYSDTERPVFKHLLTWCLLPHQDHIWKLTLTNPPICGSLHTHRSNTTALMGEAVEHLNDIDEDEVRATNKLYFVLAHALGRKRCLYHQHYLIFRDGHGGYQPLSHYMDTSCIDALADQYRAHIETGRPRRARVSLGFKLILQGVRPRALKILPQALGLLSRFSQVPFPRSARHRSLVLSFSPSCHSHNYDESVAETCRTAVLWRDSLGSSSHADLNLQSDRVRAQAQPQPQPQPQPSEEHA